MHPLVTLILQRIGLGVVTLFGISLMIFFAMEILPGDLAQETLGQSATPEAVAALRAELGLDQPAITRFFQWFSGVLHGDLGTSLANKRDISELLFGRFTNTLALASYSAVMAVPVAVTLGLLAALYRGSIFDRTVNVLSLSAVSLPEFFVAYLLIFFLSAKLGLFPSISNVSADTTFSEYMHRAFLPALTMALVVTAHMMRMTRAAIINLLASPYIEMARLKGASPMRVILIHALPNALAPIINVVSLNLAYLITGVVLVEIVFAYPGLGQLIVDSVSKRDIPVVQATCLVFATVYITLNLTADVLSIATNPRLMHRK
jgi:peptide/nickel transport system permease protein